MMKLNKIMEWTLLVNRSGCTMCSKNIIEPLDDHLSLNIDILNQRFLALRSAKLQYQMKSMPETKEFIAFYDEKNLLRMLNQLVLVDAFGQIQRASKFIY